MIRPLTLLIFLGASAAAFAQPLYKWVEKDGSITFSVTPPPAGVSFEKIDSDNTGTNTVPSGVSSATKSVANQTPAPQRPALLAPVQAVQTPTPRSRQNTRIDQDIQRQRQTISAGDALNEAPLDRGAQAALRARSRKEQQCNDLRKRVVSLERRLQTRLTPEDMDNTVIHMARYQRSFDQHCVQ